LKKYFLIFVKLLHFTYILLLNCSLNIKLLKRYIYWLYKNTGLPLLQQPCISPYLMILSSMIFV